MKKLINKNLLKKKSFKNNLKRSMKKIQLMKLINKRFNQNILITIKLNRNKI